MYFYTSVKIGNKKVFCTEITGAEALSNQEQCCKNAGGEILVLNF
jgi:hypothetical protein